MLIRIRSILLLVVIVAVLAACGGSDKPDETPTSASTSAATNPSADLEAAVRNYSSAFLTGDGQCLELPETTP